MLTINGANMPVDFDTVDGDAAQQVEDDSGRERLLYDRRLGHVSHLDTCQAKQRTVRPPRHSQPTDPRIGTREWALQVFYLREGAPPEVVKAVHRALVIKNHPDRNPGGHEATVQINLALDVLKKG